MTGRAGFTLGKTERVGGRDSGESESERMMGLLTPVGRGWTVPDYCSPTGLRTSVEEGVPRGPGVVSTTLKRVGT